jgi:hypothetical protein
MSIAIVGHFYKLGRSGRIYKVLHLASSTKANVNTVDMVVYQQYAADGPAWNILPFLAPHSQFLDKQIAGIWCRPRDEFEQTMPDGSDRFLDVGEQHPDTQAALVKAQALVASIKGAPDSLLDEGVHDTASRIGSGVNNEGVDAQILWLLEQRGNAAGLELITEIVDGYKLNNEQ